MLSLVCVIEIRLISVCTQAFIGGVAADLGDNYNTVIAPQDIAIYGGLCALATLDR